MTMKVNEHTLMKACYMLYKESEDKFHVAMHDLDAYEAKKGFGFADNYSEYAYKRFFERDYTIKMLWDAVNVALDDLRETRKAFGMAMEAFTGGEIDSHTVEGMLFSPQRCKEFEQIMFGKELTA